MRARTIRDVAERNLCTGCGVCAYLEPDSWRMVDTLDQGRRPLAIAEINGRSTSALQACPGARVAHEDDQVADHMPELGAMWGPVLEMWEGYASDSQVRYQASSGGAITAIALYCLEVRGMHGVLHTSARQDLPFLNRTVLSRSRAELLAGAGSRYAPASPCERLDLIEHASAECVFVGKPCDVAGAVSAAQQRPRLEANLGLTIAFFCAGTPTTAGTLATIRAAGMQPDEVAAVRYRGHGWPGRFTVTSRTGEERSLSYEQSWGEILQTHRQWRCMICPDHTGEFADISVGDPWYRSIEPGEPGRSLVIARTPLGRAVVRGAMEAGFLTLEPAPASILPNSQPNLVLTRGAVWGRTATMRAFGLPAPRTRRMPTFPTWWSALSAEQKLRSFSGTARRILRRKLFRRTPVLPVSGWDSQEEQPSRPT